MNVKDQMKNAKWWYSIYFKIDFILHLTFGLWHLAFSHFREWCVFRNGRFLILLAIALRSPSSILAKNIIAKSILVLLIMAACCGTVTAGEYDFTIPEARPKPYELGARLEARSITHRFDETSARYRLIRFQDDPGSDAHDWHLSAELSGKFRAGMLQAVLLTHHEFADTYTENEWTDKIYEGTCP